MAEKLKFDAIEEPEFCLIAIVTPEPIYRLCWLINQLLGISLAEGQPISLLHPKRQMIQSFMVFEYFDEEAFQKFYIIQNKGAQGVYDEDQKQVDFWFRIEGTKPSEDLVRKLKSIKEINLAFEIKPGLLKSKSRLLLPIAKDKI